MYSNLLKMTLASSILLITSGCSILPDFNWWEDEPPKEVVKIQTVEVQVPIIHPNMPRAISLKSPTWRVVSKKNLEQFLDDMTLQNGGELVFVAMTIDDYEIMASNVQEIRRYINQLKEVVVYYRTVTDKDKEDEKPDTGKP